MTIKYDNRDYTTIYFTILVGYYSQKLLAAD